MKKVLFVIQIVVVSAVTTLLTLFAIEYYTNLSEPQCENYEGHVEDNQLWAVTADKVTRGEDCRVLLKSATVLTNETAESGDDLRSFSKKHSNVVIGLCGQFIYFKFKDEDRMINLQQDYAKVTNKAGLVEVGWYSVLIAGKEKDIFYRELMEEKEKSEQLQSN